MNKKMIIRTVLSVFIILVSIATGIYFYSLLNEKKKEVEVNLYSLVPEDCIAILKTDNMSKLFNNINKVNYNKSYDSLHLSDLLSGLKNNLESLSKSKAHGLSSQMSEMLISFHSPGTSKDQVLYCKLGSGDEAFVESYIKNPASDFAPKSFEYRGEDIYIYPINATDFLACYYRSEFLAVSYQEKLIEKVIDTFLDGQSILSDSVFASVVSRKKTHMEASLYLKGRQVELGEKTSDSQLSCASIAHWGEFDIKFNPDAIYLSGISFDTDTCHSFHNALKTQIPVKTFPGSQLPESAYFLCQLSMSDIAPMFDQIIGKEHPPKAHSAATEKADSCIYDYLKENMDNTLCFFMFNNPDNTNNPHCIIHIALKEKDKAEKELRQLLSDLPEEKSNTSISGFHSKGKAYRIFSLPNLSLINRFAGTNAQNNSVPSGCFYDNRLLIAPNDSSIYAYIQDIDNGRVKEGSPIYEEYMAGLTPESNCLLLADMDKFISSPQNNGHLMPNLFFKYKDFFKNFILTIQFTYANGYIYPNISLTYKGVPATTK